MYMYVHTYVIYIYVFIYMKRERDSLLHALVCIFLCGLGRGGFAGPSEDRLYSTACDVWAFGCILFELTALKVPFEADPGNTQCIRHIKRYFESLCIYIYIIDLPTYIYRERGRKRKK